MFGEAHDHFGPFAGRTPDEQFRAFDRAIALDSAYAPSYIHPIEAAASEAPRRCAGIFGRTSRCSPTMWALTGADWFSGSSTPPASAASDLPTLFGDLSEPALFSAFSAVRRLPDSSETAVHIARFLASHPWSPAGQRLASVGAGWHRPCWRTDRSRRATTFYGRTGRSCSPIAAVFGVAPAETVAVEFRRRLSGPAGLLLAGTFPWWAGRRDTVSLRLAATHAESLARLPRSNDRATAPYVAASALAYLALARRDTSQAVQRFLALPEGGVPGAFSTG